MMGITGLLLGIAATVIAILGTAPFAKFVGIVAIPAGVLAVLLGAAELIRTGLRAWRQTGEAEPGGTRAAVWAIVLGVASAAWMTLMTVMGGGV